MQRPIFRRTLDQTSELPMILVLPFLQARIAAKTGGSCIGINDKGRRSSYEPRLP